jgi:hypothetical protein
VAVVVAVPAMARTGVGGGLVNFADCFPFCNSSKADVNQSFKQEAAPNQAINQDAAPVAAQDSNRRGSDNNRFNDNRFNDNRFNDPSVTQAIGQESQSGDVKITGNATQSGNNSNQCVTPLQFGNTGSLQNAQGVLQYGSTSGDIELGDSSFVFAPSLNAKCDQKVQQSAAASG